MRHRARATAALLLILLLAPSFAPASEVLEQAPASVPVAEEAEQAVSLPALEETAQSPASESEAAEQARARVARAEEEETGPFLGAKYRWDQMPVVRRVFWDVVAIPANIPNWDTGDWAQLALLGGAVAGLMIPLEPSGDVALDRWITRHVNPSLPTVWTAPMQGALWGSLAVGGLGTWWWAAKHERWDIAQGMSLIGESVAAWQVYHLTFKILIGREGPTDGSREGKVLGPGRGLVYYPAGTPSGHSGTLYAVLGAGFAYFNPPIWFQVLGHVAMGTVVAFHVIDHRHYISESLWGAAMGWSIGRWVVRHRASRDHMPGGPLAEPPAKARLLPIPLRDGLGLAVVGRF